MTLWGHPVCRQALSRLQHSDQNNFVARRQMACTTTTTWKLQRPYGTPEINYTCLICQYQDFSHNVNFCFFPMFFLYLFIHLVCMKLSICMQICCVNCQFYLLVLVVTTFVFIFPFLRTAVRAVSLFRPVPPFFFLFAVVYGLLWNK